MTAFGMILSRILAGSVHVLNGVVGTAGDHAESRGSQSARTSDLRATWQCASASACPSACGLQQGSHAQQQACMQLCYKCRVNVLVGGATVVVMGAAVVVWMAIVVGTELVVGAALVVVGGATVPAATHNLMKSRSMCLAKLRTASS